MSNIITSADELNFTLADIPAMPTPREVLLVKPTYFDVEYIINPHMEGHIGTIDKMAAMNEWDHLKTAYEELGIKTHVVDGVRGYPDMVFCANQSWPYIDEDGNKHVIMSTMHSEQRKGEVEYIEEFYKGTDYEIHHLDPKFHSDFEGMGDAIWHFGKRLVYGGFGFRSNKEVYVRISEHFNVPVVRFELKDPKFYHLDTCFCSLNEDTVMIYPEAFSEGSLETIHKLIPNVIECNKYESEELFACNAVCPDGKNVLIQQGCIDANSKLREAGFKVHEFSTFEYLKSGGSVFCMKLMLF